MNIRKVSLIVTGVSSAIFMANQLSDKKFLSRQAEKGLLATAGISFIIYLAGKMKSMAPKY